MKKKIYPQTQRKIPGPVVLPEGEDRTYDVRGREKGVWEQLPPSCDQERDWVGERWLLPGAITQSCRLYPSSFPWLFSFTALLKKSLI